MGFLPPSDHFYILHYLAHRPHSALSFTRASGQDFTRQFTFQINYENIFLIMHCHFADSLPRVSYVTRTISHSSSPLRWLTFQIIFRFTLKKKNTVRGKPRQNDPTAVTTLMAACVHGGRVEGGRERCCCRRKR